MAHSSRLTIPDEEFSSVTKEKVEDYAVRYGHTDPGDGLAQWATELLLDVEEDVAFNASYVGKVGHDHGLDSIIRLEQTLYLLQVKSTADFKPGTFNESVIDDFLRCLKWLGNPALYPETSGYDFQRASQRYRQAIEVKCNVRMLLVVYGDLSPDARTRFEVEKKKVASMGDFTLELRTFWDLKEKYLDSLKIEQDFKDAISLKVQADQSFERTQDGLKAIVVSVPAQELKRIYDQYDRRLFFYNVRFYLGSNAINKQIMGTLENGNKYKPEFWHLNNGIVVVCDEMEWQDKAHSELKLVAPQIVNGCQTVATIAAADVKGYELEGIDVLARIIQTTDRDFALRITQATNTQNPNTARDLASNQPEQVRLQSLFSTLDPPYFYQRKRKEFDNLERAVQTRYKDPTSKKPRLIDNEKVANSYLSFVRQMPAEARTRARELFVLTTSEPDKETYYDMIFKGEKTAEEYLLPELLAEKVDAFLHDFKKSRNVFENGLKKRMRAGEKQTAEDEAKINDFRSKEALPYARTQIVGLLYLLIDRRYGRYDVKVARGLLGAWSKDPALFDPLIDFAVDTIVRHTNSARMRDPTIEMDNAYKLAETYRELVEELKSRLADKFLKSPLERLPDI